MTRHEIMLILERYDVDPKTHNIIADKILALSSVVGRSEQLQGFFEFYKQKFGGGFNTDVLEITLRQYQETL